MRETRSRPKNLHAGWRWLGLAAVIAVYWAAMRGSEFKPAALRDAVPAIGALLWNMLPPDFGYLPRLLEPAVQTLQVGILSTLVSSALALPVAYLAARNFSPSRSVFYGMRFVLTVFRGISELIWALIFVVAVGLGPFAGVLAIIVFGVGAQGKLLAEAIENADQGPVEALIVAGVPRWKAFIYAAFPGVWVEYVAQSLHFWDHNTRAAAILGFVGAGGLGYTLLHAIGAYQYPRAAMAIIVLVAMITLIDRLSLWLRRRIA